MLPGATINRVDGNLGLVRPVPDKPLVIGPTTLGNAGDRHTFSDPNRCVQTLGHGRAVTQACHILDIAGGSVDVLVTDASVASDVSAVTASLSGPEITVDGDPTEIFDGILKITTGGGLGTGRFQYSLDGGQTYGTIRTIPGGGVFEMPGSGLTVNFANDTFVQDELYTFTAVPATYDSGDVDGAFEALFEESTRWKLVASPGQVAASSDAVVIAETIGGYMADLADLARDSRALVDCGADSVSNVQGDWEDSEDLRLARFYGQARIQVANPIEGWRRPMLPCVISAAAMATKFTRGTNLAWVGIGTPPTGGRIPKCSAISFDEYIEGEQLHDRKINTTRTFVGRGGFYFTNGLLASPAGSDFRYLHWGLAFDVCCQVAYDGMVRYVNSSQPIKTDGTKTITSEAAAKINTQIDAQLRAAVLDPNTEQGKGYVSAVQFRIDETFDILTSSKLRGSFNAVPKANTEQIELTGGLATSIVSDAPPAEAP